jgi:prepilin-type processing-associated H-X9-DG protein
LQRGIGERTARKLPSTWIGFVLTGEDAQARVLGNAWLGPNRIDADECEFDSRHPSCVNFLWADGHFAPVADAIDAALYRDLARRN